MRKWENIWEMRKYVLKTTASSRLFPEKVVASFIKRKTMLYSFFDKGLTKYIEIKKRRAIKIGDIIIKVTKVDINIAYLSFYCAYYK